LYFSKNLSSSFFFLSLSGSILGISSIMGYHRLQEGQRRTPSVTSLLIQSLQGGVSWSDFISLFLNPQYSSHRGGFPEISLPGYSVSAKVIKSNGKCLHMGQARMSSSRYFTFIYPEISLLTSSASFRATSLSLASTMTLIIGSVPLFLTNNQKSLSMIFTPSIFTTCLSFPNSSSTLE